MEHPLQQKLCNTTRSTNRNVHITTTKKTQPVRQIKAGLFRGRQKPRLASALQEVALQQFRLAFGDQMAWKGQVKVLDPNMGLGKPLVDQLPPYAPNPQRTAADLFRA